MTVTHEELVVAFRDVMSHAQRLLTSRILAVQGKPQIDMTTVAEDAERFRQACHTLAEACTEPFEAPEDSSNT